MQRLFSLKIASKLSGNSTSSSSSSLLHHLPYKTFTYLPKPNPTQNNKTHHHFFSHFTNAQTQSWKPHSHKTFRQFLSNPVFLKHFLLDSSHSLLRVSSRSLMDARVRFLRTQFCRDSFRFRPSLDSHRRGWRSWFRGLTANDMVLGLIVANVAVFMLWRVGDRKFMMNNFTLSLDNFKNGHLHTLITSAFSHIDSGHIISNMIGLYFFGIHIAGSFGPEFLLKLYLAGAIGGSVFYLIHQAFMASSSKGERMWSGNANAPALGASGAVNAIMLLQIFLFPKATLYLDFIIPVPAILLGIFLVAKDTLRIIEGDSHISGSAHLGGAAVGAMAWALVKRGRF